MDPVAAAAPVQFVMDYRTQKIADLPIFNGDKTDTISAEDFVRKTTAAKDAMRWDNATTAVHFKACLRGKALEWLKSKEFRGINTNDWEASLKPLFTKEFVKAFKEVSTLTAISQLTLKSDENPREFDARICSIFADIKKARPAYVANIPDDKEERTDEYITNQINAAMDHDMMHIIKCVFISGLPTELREKVVEKKPTTIDEAKDVAQDLFEMQTSRKTSAPKIHSVYEEKEEWTDDKIEAIKDDEIKEAILAIQRKRQGYFKNSGNSNYKGQNRGNQRGNRSFQPERQNNQSQGNGRSNEAKFCLYCNKDNHNQEYCWTRKSRNAPLNDKTGKPMNTPGTHEFNLWKNELKAKGKTVMVIDDNSYAPASAKSVTLN